MKIGKSYQLFSFILNFVYLCHSVDVHFESADSGFFLKHTRQPLAASELLTTAATTLKSSTSYDSILSIDRFTIVQTVHPVSIRASYGPFSTKQTVPARYIVPDIKKKSSDYMNNTTAALLELEKSNMHLDVSAHLVNTNVSPDDPALRVLFHAGTDPVGHLKRQKICVLLHVSSGIHSPLKSHCVPGNEDGVCVAEVVIPFSWFHLFLPTYGSVTSTYTHVKLPQRFIQLSYSTFEPPLDNPEMCEPKVQIQPLIIFSQIPLVTSKLTFKELHVDDLVTMFLPQRLLYPTSKFHVPVYLHQPIDKPVLSFSMKARVKTGIKIIYATNLNDMWNISFEKENSKHTTAKVTATRKEYNENIDHLKMFFNKTNGRTEIVFSWLFEIAAESEDQPDSGKIVWSIMYMNDTPKIRDISADVLGLEDNKKKIITKLEINKDDIQAVLPMAKNWELMNTAVLTGRQVAQTMKVYIVSQGGKIADVTLQSSCHAEDESVIKVSSSCSSVYVDGSEIRGSSNATVIVKYGASVGLAKFIVWMPEFPLEVYINDFRLSQIKGWKIIDKSNIQKKLRRRKKRSSEYSSVNEGLLKNYSMDKMVCRVRYQQSPVDVYARFVATDQNSGRVKYFISRRTELRVTDLVQPLLRIADPKIATLKGRILQGKAMGRTDVQVLSPITGRIIGAKEIRVGSDKVNLNRIIVRVVSGLQLIIIPDNTNENGYFAETTVTRQLTAQYQEGLLDIDLEFSDGSRTPLRDISVEDYYLLVESLDTEVVAFAPMLASHHPRVIAVGEGNGNLLRITLLLSDACRGRRNSNLHKHLKIGSQQPLATSLASVQVDFNNDHDAINKFEIIQNDGIDGKSKYRNGDLADIIGVQLRDSVYHNFPTVQTRQYHNNMHSSFTTNYKEYNFNERMSAMEVGMYVLLTAFCLAIVVFIISCLVYASKFKPYLPKSSLDNADISEKSYNYNNMIREFKFTKKSSTSAHDWVWLGRSAVDKSRMDSNVPLGQGQEQIIHPDGSRIRITSNPIIKYPNNDANTIGNLTSFLCKYSENRIQTSIPPISSKRLPKDYRPPVPPHQYNREANISNQNNIITSEQTNNNNNNNNHNNNELYGSQFNAEKDYNFHAHYQPILMNKSLHLNCKSNESPLTLNDGIEMKHCAESLLEAENYPENIFKFDRSISPNHVNLKNTSTTIDDRNTRNHSNDFIEQTEYLERFARPKSPATNSHLKRITIVGNPMFFNSSAAQENSFILDDVDMDYKQIMQYFDNLKESNA